MRLRKMGYRDTVVRSNKRIYNRKQMDKFFKKAFEYKPGTARGWYKGEWFDLTEEKNENHQD